MPNQLFVCSIYPNWTKLLRKAQQTRSFVQIYFPYLKGKLALSLLKLVPPDCCEIFTVCSIENFANGASSVQTFRELIESKYLLFHVDGLHAKVVLVRGSYATLGSQNLTPAGTRNREVSVGLPAAEDVKALETAIEKWRRVGRLVDLEEIQDIESVLLPVKEQARRLRARIESAQETVRSAREERIRLDQKLRQEALDQKLRKEILDQRLRQAIHECTTTIDALIPAGRVSEIMAKEFMSLTGVTKWNRHRRVQHVDGLVKYVIDEPDWRFDLSRGTKRTHKFLIERAITECVSLAKRFADDPGADVAEGFLRLTDELRHTVRCSVARPNGVQYEEPYGTDPDYVWLGNNGVDVDEFVNEILTLTNLGPVLRRGPLGAL